METLNPLDWTARPFLLLYVALAGGALVLLLVWRNRLGGRAPNTTAAALGVLHLAYLAGGADFAVGVALVGLLEAGAAVPDRRRGLLRFNPSVPVAAEFQPFRHVSRGETSRAGFRAEFAQRWDRLRRELTECGLVPGDAEVARFRWQGAVLLGLPLLLGACKAMVGVARDRPVGILVMLMVLTGMLGAALLARPPHRNRSGAAVLAAARRDHARAARAPLPEEIPLAVALSGTAVLAGRDYSWVLTYSVSSSTGDGGSDTGGSGDGGGGCGGCSG